MYTMHVYVYNLTAYMYVMHLPGRYTFPKVRIGGGTLLQKIKIKGKYILHTFCNNRVVLI